MLDPDADFSRVVEFFEHIREPAAREVFLHLIGAFTCSPVYTWRPRNQGEVRAIGVYSGGLCLLAFMPSMQKVRFHVRPPAVSADKFSKDYLKALGLEVDENSKAGHWVIDLSTLDQCRKLLVGLRVTPPREAFGEG